jgi:hypothetical protein
MIKQCHFLACFLGDKNEIFMYYSNFRRPLSSAGVRGGVFGGGTVLQTGRSRVRFPMVSLECFFDVILLAAV